MTASHASATLLDTLFDVPLVGAPMAGGPSTPQLAAAIAATGATGFLAGGNRDADALVADYREAVRLRDERGGSGVIGVNLFVPEAANAAVPAERRDPSGAFRRERAAAVAAYRDELAAEAARAGAALPELDALDPDATDDWDAKLAAAERERWPLVTFTFGLPRPDVFARLHAAGATLGVTVTSAPEAAAAIAHGADLLVVQGPEAGGHRSVHDPAAAPPETSLAELAEEVIAEVSLDVPLVLSGGITTDEQVRAGLAVGVAAVQCGTAFLRAPEAGTSQTHRDALAAAAAGTAFKHTAVTRAFSGRPARSLRNAFMDAHPAAPAAYPEVQQLVGPLRRAAAAAGDADRTNLWAGINAVETRAWPAADIVADLLTRVE